MGTIRALLVGVCEYPTLGYAPLPLCKNDLYELRNALINGLNVTPENIILCGGTGNVNLLQLRFWLNYVLSDITNEDTFIFYFSGHGGKNCLALSDGLINLQNLIETMESVNIKNKIIILDSCHSGGFSLSNTPKMDINEIIENFAGHGCAVLASCGTEQTSGFNNSRQISLYTSFVCDALMSRFLIRKGKKSLESINEAIFRFAEISNKRNEANIQQPIFRSSIGGTIFFDVEDYNPYKVTKIYEETDSYIIYDVKPRHSSIAKRLYVKVILRFKSSMEYITEIAREIKNKILYCEVYQNKIDEERYRGKPVNIVWCYFGYDEDDMVNCNFICHTTWVDDLQNKKWWYRTNENALFINDVKIESNSLYESIKNLQDDVRNKDELIQLTKEYSSNIISIAEQYIQIFREYLNNTLTEEQLIDGVAPLNKEISLWFLKQNDLPIPPNELHDWAHAYTKIACTIHDFSIFYDRKNLKTWSSENRKWLMSNTIKQYEIELEELRIADKLIQ